MILEEVSVGVPVDDCVPAGSSQTWLLWLLDGFFTAAGRAVTELELCNTMAQRKGLTHSIQSEAPTDEWLCHCFGVELL